MVPAELAGGSHDKWAPSELWMERESRERKKRESLENREKEIFTGSRT